MIRFRSSTQRGASNKGATHKYHAVKVDTCTGCGLSHPSKKEAKRCVELHLLQRAGEIRDLRTQARYPLFGPGGLPLMTQGRATGGYRKQITMTWDFAYEGPLGSTVEDSKGLATAEFQLRRSVFEACYPELQTVVS